MFHPMNVVVAHERVAIALEVRRDAQLKRGGYRDFREPRRKRHWANR